MESLETRVGELERTVCGLVEYLKRMPVSPLTYGQIQHAEAILHRRVAGRPLVADSYTPTGILVAGVAVVGDEVTVLTNAPASEAHNLWKSLQEGITMTLKPRDV
jgi:hypothetical protein